MILSCSALEVGTSGLVFKQLSQHYISCSSAPTGTSRGKRLASFIVWTFLDGEAALLIMMVMATKRCWNHLHKDYDAADGVDEAGCRQRAADADDGGVDGDYNRDDGDNDDDEVDDDADDVVIIIIIIMNIINEEVVVVLVMAVAS